MLVVLACVLAGSASTAAGALSTPTIGGNVDPALDVTEPGTVGVVASGAPIAGVVPVIVQNRKARAVTHLRISAHAVDGDGRTVARATTRTVVPNVLDHNSLGLARVDFHDRLLPLGLTFEFVVTSEPARDASTATLEPTQFRLSPPLTGRVAQTLDVTLQNATAEPTRGPVRIAVMCFGESRRPVLYAARTVRAAHLAPGGSMSTRVDFHELCPAYVIGANAVSAR
jgi:hypothetical protein